MMLVTKTSNQTRQRGHRCLCDTLKNYETRLSSPQPSLRRSAICVVPECSTLVVSGADPGAAVASTFAASPSDFMSPNPDGGEPSGASAQGGAVDDPFRRNSAYLAAGGYGRSVGGGGVASVGSCGVGARKEHAGAWLLTESVKSLLAALVAVPGHPDLGPLYLFRGLIKAIRRRVHQEKQAFYNTFFLCYYWRAGLFCFRLFPPSEDWDRVLSFAVRGI